MRRMNEAWSKREFLGLTQLDVGQCEAGCMAIVNGACEGVYKQPNTIVHNTPRCESLAMLTSRRFATGLAPTRS